MTDDEHKPGGGKTGDGSDDATQLRQQSGVDKDDEATQLRGGKPGVEKTQMLDAQDPQDAAESGEVDIVVNRPSRSAGNGADEDEATQLRGSGSATAADDDEDDATELRGTASAASDEDEEDSTQLRSGPGRAAGDGDDATQLRGSSRGDTDITQVNSKTQNMPAIGRAALGPSADADRLRRQAAAPGEDDATSLRGSPGNTQSDATRIRPDNLPDDEDVTIQGGSFSDEDVTVQAGTESVHDDDATVQAAGGGRSGAAAPSDDDPTQQGNAQPAGGSARAAIPKANKTVGSGAVLKGRFTLEDKLGEGGMGGVFKAVDLVKQEARDRHPYVAVKLMNEAFAEHEDSFIALQRESSRSMRLTHPNIAAVYDFDRDGDVAYMVMELLEGAPLDAHLKKNKQGLEPELARSVIRNIAEALAYAHTQTPALVHSDFKPGNIFFLENGTAKVFDFGIARAATGGDDVIKNQGVDLSTLTDDDDDEKESTLFDAGKLGALTPAYASIEMFEGRDPAPQDDVYALGIVAYQCLTGKHPFDRKKAPVAEAQEMVAKRPEGVSRREWRAIRHALAFKREDRTPDAQAFLDEFFGVAGRTLLAVAATVTAMSIGVGALYFAGVIGPSAPTAQPDADWVALESEITVSRDAVIGGLQNQSFSANNQFVAWEGVIQRDLAAWDGIDAPRIVLAGEYADEAAAIAEQDRIFQQTGLSVGVIEESGIWHLVAGPFRRTAEEQMADDDPVAFADFQGELERLGIEHEVERDDQAIAQARDEALSVYLAEFERRLPTEDPPRVEARVRLGERFLVRDPNPRNEATQPDLRAGGFWVIDPVAEAEIRGWQDTIRAAGSDTDEADIRRGDSVLGRAEKNFPTRPGDIATARARAAQLLEQWEESISSGQARASRYQVDFARSEQTVEDEESRALERSLVAEARRDGNEGEPIRLSLTFAEFGLSAPGDVEYAGVYEVFSRECNVPSRVEAALADYPDLLESEQKQALDYLSYCMNAKLEKDTAQILESRDVLLAQVDYAPIAAIQEPDPCGKIGYVGAGRSAQCRDAMASGGTAPAVVIVDGVGANPNYGIGQYEVSIGNYNDFCEATGCETLAGASRLPATGIGVDQARAYTNWLSEQTGHTYRLPTVDEWRHAAQADGAAADPNRNCYSNVRGVIRGESPVNVGQGAPNSWGLVNHVGNVEEWAEAGSGLALLGGRHTDELVQCTAALQRDDAGGSAEPTTGFRVVREIDRQGAMIAGTAGK